MSANGAGEVKQTAYFQSVITIISGASLSEKRKSGTRLLGSSLFQKAIIEVFIMHRKDILILLAVVAIAILLGGISGKLLLDNLI